MPPIDKHSPGSFCWVELSTTDQQAAKKFYCSLFGWSVTDSPIGPNDFYSLFRLGERDTAAAFTMRKEQRDHGVSPHWELYVAVDKADDSAAVANSLGGKVMASAFDVMEAGRMAVLQDPAGAGFCVWQAGKHAGMGVAGDDNTFCWADLSTPDPEKAVQFYSSLFGWSLVRSDNDPGGYFHIKNGETFIGGIPPASRRPPQAPAHWMVYFQVADVEASAVRAADMGAKIVMAPRKMENVGSMAVIADPQGAVFALFRSARK